MNDIFVDGLNEIYHYALRVPALGAKIWCVLPA